MQRTVRATALVIVPLAGAVNTYAGSMNTGPVLPQGSASCSAFNTPSVGSPSGGSCSSSAFNVSALGPNGITGVSLYTNGSDTFYGGGGGTAQLILSASGLLTGAAIPSGTSIPLHYFFTLQFQNGIDSASVSSWTLDFQLLDGASVIGDSGSIPNTSIDNGAINDGGQGFFGDSSLSTTSSAALNDTLTEQVTLYVAWSAGDNDQLIVNVPAPSTFDYDPTVGTSSVPEPGTMALTGSAFVLADFFLLRRKKGRTLIRSGR